MPVISFTTLKEKILSGEKKQTIRPNNPKTNWWLKWKKGDKLIGYWKLRSYRGAEADPYKPLFVSIFSEDPFSILWKDFTDELMIRDCFESLKEANEKWFIDNYGLVRYPPEGGEIGIIIPDKEFVVIRWA
jgi:hypothetical protein